MSLPAISLCYTYTSRAPGPKGAGPMNDPIHPSTNAGPSAGTLDVSAEPPGRAESKLLERIARRTCAWSERWIPDAYVFAAAAVVIVGAVALILGTSPVGTAKAFGDGFW